MPGLIGVLARVLVAVYGPFPENVPGTFSLLTATSAPNPMPTAVFAANPIPVTLTELPATSCEDDKEIEAIAALANGATNDNDAKTIENVRKNVIVVEKTFVECFIFCLPEILSMCEKY